MVVQLDLEKTYTVAEFEELYGYDKNYDLIDGKVVEVSPAGRRHGRVGTMLAAYLGMYVMEHKLGETHGADTGWVLAVNTVRAADVAFITSERLADLDEDGFIPVPPDLAVEVVSPSDFGPEIKKKVELYHNAGVPLVWTIHPIKKIVKIYRLNDPEITTLTADDELDGEDIVPGFKLKISKLFD